MSHKYYLSVNQAVDTPLHLRPKMPANITSQSYVAVITLSKTMLRVITAFP